MAGSANGLSVAPAAAVMIAGEPASAARPVSTPVETGAADTGSPTQNVGEQILDSLRASLGRGENQVSIRLHPPELGSVLVRFREEGERLRGLVEVGRSETRAEIEQALPQVLRHLQDAGIRVERLEVATQDQGERDFNRSPLQQEAHPQHQHGSRHEPDRFEAPSPRDESAGRAHGPDSLEGEPDAGPRRNTAPGRIDMLL